MNCPQVRRKIHRLAEGVAAVLAHVITSPLVHSLNVLLQVLSPSKCRLAEWAAMITPLLMNRADMAF